MKKPTIFDEMLADLHAKGFRSEDEIMEYLMNPAGKAHVDPSREAPVYLSRKTVALKLVMQAMNEDDPEKVEGLLAEALMNDPECIEAYESMGYQEQLPFFATVWFEKAIRLGEKQFGKMYRRYHEGSLWQYPETHAYLHSLNRYAECQWAVGNAKEAIRTYKDLLALDPDDHQSCRWKMIANMMQSFDYGGMHKAFQQYKDDGKAFAKYLSWLERSIFRDKKLAEQLFAEATARNPSVPGAVISHADIEYIYDDFQPGSKEEAGYIASFIAQICEKDHTIMSTLKKYERSHRPDNKSMRRIK